MFHVPFRASFVSNVIEPQIVHDKGRPIVLGKLVGNVPSHVIIYFCKVLKEDQFQCW